MTVYIRRIGLLTLVYLALTSNLQVSNLVVGILLGAVIVYVVRPEKTEVAPRNVMRSGVASARYILHLAHVLLVTGIDVSRIVLSPALPIRPGIIAIPAETETEVGLALSVHAITLAPGELVVEVDDAHVMYTHCLDATHAEEFIKEAHHIRLELLDEIFE